MKTNLTITWVNNRAKLIDQTILPNTFKYIYCDTTKEMWDAIKMLKVRGAPAIGVAAAFGILLGIKETKTKDRKAFDAHIKKVSHYLSTSRPTAVNLFNVLEIMESVLSSNPDDSVTEIKKKLKAKALEVYEADRKECRAMGAHGSQFIKEGYNVLTVCNAGALATVDYGTALAVMYKAKEEKKNFSVYACETRPLLQGARLTTWELMQAKIPTTLICDNMAATLMQQGKIDAIFTGADRVVSNGDAANKIGTYSLAVLAKYHKIPFYIVAPYSTFDLKAKTGKEIPIEERSKDEVINFRSTRTAPKDVNVYNPAFDVTPASLITAIITERGVIQKPFAQNIKKWSK